MSRLSGSVRSFLLIALILLAAWAVTIQRAKVRLVPQAEAAMASSLTLVDLEGQTHDLRDYAGQVVVVNLWAGWCGPCRSEVPGFNRVFDDLRDEGLVMLGVNVEGLSPDGLAASAGELGVTYPVLRPVGAFAGTFLTDGTIPHSWLIDRAGRVRASHRGYLAEGSLLSACRTLLAE